jgi:hypothetical protein
VHKSLQGSGGCGDRLHPPSEALLIGGPPTCQQRPWSLHLGKCELGAMWRYDRSRRRRLSRNDSVLGRCLGTPDHPGQRAGAPVAALQRWAMKPSGLAKGALSGVVATVPMTVAMDVGQEVACSEGTFPRRSRIGCSPLPGRTWPNVNNGRASRDGGRSLFDSLLAGANEFSSISGRRRQAPGSPRSRWSSASGVHPGCRRPERRPGHDCGCRAWRRGCAVGS